MRSGLTRCGVPRAARQERGSVAVPLLAVMFLVAVALFVMFRLGEAAYLQWRAQTGADAAALAAADQTREDMLEAAKAIAREDYARAAAIMARAPGNAAAAAAYYAARNRAALTSFDWQVVEVEVQVATFDVVPHPCVGDGPRRSPRHGCTGHGVDCSPAPRPSGLPPSAQCNERSTPKGTRGKAIARARVEVKLSSVGQGTTAEQFASIRLIPDRTMAMPHLSPVPVADRVRTRTPGGHL